MYSGLKAVLVLMKLLSLANVMLHDDLVLEKANS